MRRELSSLEYSVSYIIQTAPYTHARRTLHCRICIIFLIGCLEYEIYYVNLLIQWFMGKSHTETPSTIVCFGIILHSVKNRLYSQMMK